MSLGAGTGSDAARVAVRAAAQHLPAARPEARVFLEDRVAARLTVSPRGGTVHAEVRTVGVAIDGENSRYISDPSLSDLSAGAHATGMPRPGGCEDAGSRVLPGTAIPTLAWREWTERHAANDLAIHFSAHHQNIWVAGRDMDVREDIRRSIRIEVRSLTAPGATVDAVLRPTEPIPGELVSRVRARAEARRGSVRHDPHRDGPPLIFGPGVAGVVIHELVGHALEGDAPTHGMRLPSLTERVGIADLRVIDDPALARASWRVDDAGEPARAVTLLEGGRVAGRLLAGHRRRGSFLDPILPRMGCTYIDRGEAHPDEILSETARGLYVHRLVAGHADPRLGRATFIVTEAHRIEGGTIAQPLLPFVLELDVVEALGSIDRIGSDLAFDTCIGSCVRSGQPLAVSVGAPTVRLGVITAIL